MDLQSDMLGLPLGDWRVVLLGLTIVALLLTVLGFAGSASALRVRNNRKANRWARLEEKWGGALAAVLSGAAEVSTLLSEIAPGEELYFVDFLFRRARAGDRPEVLEGLARPHLHRIAARLQGGDAERRARAVQTVSVLGFDAYADRVLAALDDESPLVAMVAARSLARAGGSEYVVPIIERLDRFEDWSPRFLKSMLESLGSDAAPALRDSLGDATHPPRIRAVFADALRQSADERAADTAASVIQSETDGDVLAACLRLLRKLGSAEHVAPVKALLASNDYAIRAQAVGALGRLGGPAEADLIRRALDDPSPWVVLQAERVLREWADPTTHLLLEKVR